MAQAFFVTTPIYYVNDRPHIGHAYSSVAADVLHRYALLRGRPSWSLSGTDEHGQKIERRAKQEQLSSRAFVDRMAPRFESLGQLLHCAQDDFIRTTEERHRRRAQALWRRLEAAGDIYLGEYEGWYSVEQETYYTEKELLPGSLCPLTHKPVERVKEPSYFFRLSAFTDRLLALYAANPEFVQPEGRYNEVKRFVEQGLRDLSISRTSFRWGVPVPGNPRHVMYVWLDALTNYLSALGAPTEAGEEPSPEFSQHWPPSGRVVHVVGKDILRFHAIYWPAFLMSAGLEVPSQIWAHGWLTVDGVKMSKSLGNFIPPEPLCETFGADALRYYLMRDVALGQDGDFNHDGLVARYHGDLGNGLGNLLNRIVASLVPKYLSGKTPPMPRPAVAQDSSAAEDQALVATAQRVAAAAAAAYEAVAPHRALDAVWELVTAANRYIDQTAPWSLAKEGRNDRLSEVMARALESLRWLSLLLWPVMPERSDAIRHQLGLQHFFAIEGVDAWPGPWGALPQGLAVRPGEPLFPRLDDAVQPHSSPTSAPTTPVTGAATDAAVQTEKKPKPPEKPLIDFDDFAKVDLRLGTICRAERVPKSGKLLKLAVDLGEATQRQIVAGLGKTYEPESIEGRQVVVVANLKPRKIMGLESHGMVLAVSDDSGLSILSPERALPAGTVVS